MNVRRWTPLVGLIALAACTARDAETDEAAIAADSAAASVPLPQPVESAGTGAGVKTVPGPLDATPSVPRETTPGAGSMPGPARDTLRGVIALVGADPMVRITLRGDSRGAVTLRGAPELATLAGLELWVAGTRRDGALEVSEFAVRAADGVPAIDGVLTEREGRLSLARTGGSTELPGAPAAIRALIGKRVWVTMANGEVHTFGAIEPRR